MKFVLICHDDEPLTKDGMARWLNSFSELVAVVVIQENKSRLKKRVKREISRSGLLGFLDVLAFRLYHKLFMAKSDSTYEQKTLSSLKKTYPALTEKTKVFYTDSPNSPKAIEFLSALDFDFCIARCKTILKADVFEQAKNGTYVMHPGICPDYRNAHGCFWAMVNFDYHNVGMTLLKVDKGIDTGPVYGYFYCDNDFANDSHNIIQSKVVFDNLEKIADRFSEIYRGEAEPISTEGRPSGEWGQPWLSKYLKWKKVFKKGDAVS